MDATPIIAAVQEELRKHIWDTFTDESARGGKGIVRPGCPACRKMLNTSGQFPDHISQDVLPGVIEAAAKQST
jgi:hypothetical protein